MPISVTEEKYNIKKESAMKKRAAASISAGIVTLGLCVFASDKTDVRVLVNGSELSNGAYIINDSVYVPLRAVGEALGADVNWDGETRTASVDLENSENLSRVIADVSTSVVAIVGNYKPEYMSQQALSYNESFVHGTGVVIRNNGTILTNAHVVKEIENITVLFGNGESCSGSVQYIDEVSDLAVVKVNKLGLKPIKFGTKDDIVVGKTVIAIGTPISLNMMNSATKGIISGKGVSIGEYYYYTQSDAAINGGNSGGPLVDTTGRLIGINSQKLYGSGVEGLSFSIPIDTVEYVLSQFDANKKVLRPDFGLTFTESWEAKRGLPTKRALTVKTSKDNSIAAGDVINSVNGIEIHSVTDFNEALKSTYTSGEAEIKFTHAGQEKIAMITPELK